MSFPVAPDRALSQGAIRRNLGATFGWFPPKGSDWILCVPSEPSSLTLVLITGVAGSGKSTIGRRLATEIGWDYFEADDFHPAANVAKMSRGEPLNDSDRAPWLASIRARMDECAARGMPAVFSCSALKAAYRQALVSGQADVLIVFLKADPEIVTRRIASRSGHFMKADLVRSQFESLEPPDKALVIDARMAPDEIVQRIRASLGA